jgi:hypothetical protein
MFTRIGYVALLAEAARTRAHAPGLVVSIKKNLNFEANHHLVKKF